MRRRRNKVILAGAGAAVIIFTGLLLSYLLMASSGDFGIWGPLASLALFIVLVSMVTVPLWYDWAKRRFTRGANEKGSDPSRDA